jgi:16S rRNA (guanine527-N7)-methyltransferase
VFHVKHSDLESAVEPAEPTDPHAVLAAGLLELGLRIADRQREQLLQLAALLERWNERMNLSGHRSATDLTRRLILDALALLQRLPVSFQSLVDLGSGAGVPGLPIAILRPQSRILLVEAREKKHHFQRAAMRELGLRNVRALRGRFGELPPEPAQVVIAQAVSRPEEVLRGMLPWVQPGGIAAIPGSEEPPDPGAPPQIGEVRIARYQTPLGGARRTLWLGKRR